MFIPYKIKEADSMNNKRQANKNLKLSETDRKVLVTYSGTSMEQMLKPKSEILLDKKFMKL